MLTAVLMLNDGCFCAEIRRLKYDSMRTGVQTGSLDSTLTVRDNMSQGLRTSNSVVSGIYSIS